MPTLLQHTDCPQCGRRHHFCLTDGPLDRDRDYPFVCPQTAARALLRPGRDGLPVAHYPQGAVRLEAPAGTWRADPPAPGRQPGGSSSVTRPSVIS